MATTAMAGPGQKPEAGHAAQTSRVGGWKPTTCAIITASRAALKGRQRKVESAAGAGNWTWDSTVTPEHLNLPGLTPTPSFTYFLMVTILGNVVTL